jgi:orotidine-5'-phosphate decarboxylase
MDRQQLFEQIRKKKSFLCIGLDTDIQKIPQHLLELEDPIFTFNKDIIDATNHLCVAYKPNLAFYESLGAPGLVSLEKTEQYIRTIDPNIFIIADAKRGDIGNTSSLYARAFFERMHFDAVTVAPYMGEDSVAPFLQYEGKWAIILALTSNKGSDDFQTLTTGSLASLYEEVLKKSQKWGTTDNIMYVVGATKAEKLAEIRAIVPNHFLLVPGVGTQGGSLADVMSYGMNEECGLLINASRDIIYAGPSTNFAEIAARVAYERYQVHMEVALRVHHLL